MIYRGKLVNAIPTPHFSTPHRYQGQMNEFVVSPRKASGAPITDVTAVSAFAAEGSTYSFAGED